LKKKKDEEFRVEYMAILDSSTREATPVLDQTVEVV